MARLSTETQLQVLTLIARGDSYGKISEAMNIPVSTIQGVKERNPGALENIKDKLISHKISTSKKILSKSQELLEGKLDKAIRSEVSREEAIKQYQDGLIDYDEFQKLTFGLSDISITELNSVARDAFHQSQIQDGKPTSISSTPVETREELTALVRALEEGDEVTLERIVWNGGQEIQVLT